MCCGHHWRKLSVFEHAGHGQSLPSCLSGRRQESLDSFPRIPPWLCVSGLIWEVSLNRPLVNFVGFCQRPQSVEVPRTTSGGPIFDQMERFFGKTVALCSLEVVNEHINRRQWAQPKSVGACSIFASPFSALVSRVTVSISPTTS